MRKILFALLGASTSLYAGAVLVSNPNQMPSTVDVLTWNQLGADQSSVASTFLAYTAGNATGNEPVVGHLANGKATLITAGTDWTASPGITDGESLLWTDAGTGGSGPVTLSTMPISGLGSYIQADGGGQFTANIQAFAGVNSVLDLSVTSDSAGDAVFLGVSDSAAEITRVVYSLTSAPIGYSTNDFVLGQLYVQDPFLHVVAPPVLTVIPQANTAPEPGMAPLVGLALPLLFLGFKLKKRHSALRLKSLS